MPAAATLSATGTIATPIAVAIESVLTNGELGFLALRRLPLGTRQRRANQRSMHRPFIFTSVGVVGRGWDFFGSSRDRILWWGDEIFRSCGERFIRDRSVGRSDRRRHERAAVDGSGDERSTGLLLSRRRHLGLLVLVFRIARGAACLLHLVLDHGDDRVIGNAALARTVVVKNVTEPNPALLHELPRSFYLLVGPNNEE